MADLVDRQAAIDALTTYIYNVYKAMTGERMLTDKCRQAAESVLGELPTVQPTITHEQAIDYLHETGWLQNHDRILTESKIVSPVQPERIKGHWIEITLRNHTYKCSVCGRLLVNITDGKNNVAKNYPYCHCGADMREDNQNECRNNS